MIKTPDACKSQIPHVSSIPLVLFPLLRHSPSPLTAPLPLPHLSSILSFLHHFPLLVYRLSCHPSIRCLSPPLLSPTYHFSFILHLFILQTLKFLFFILPSFAYPPPFHPPDSFPCLTYPTTLHSSIFFPFLTSLLIFFIPPFLSFSHFNYTTFHTSVPFLSSSLLHSIIPPFLTSFYRFPSSPPPSLYSSLSLFSDLLVSSNFFFI